MNAKFTATNVSPVQKSRDAEYARAFDPPFKRYDDPIGSPESWMSRTAAVVGLVLLAVACVGAVWIIAAAFGAPVGLIF
jgi:hypothetical protein